MKTDFNAKTQRRRGVAEKISNRGLRGFHGLILPYPRDPRNPWSQRDSGPAEISQDNVRLCRPNLALSLGGQIGSRTESERDDNFSTGANRDNGEEGLCFPPFAPVQ